MSEPPGTTSAAGGAPPAGPSTAGKLVNFVAFQAVWFICVYGAADARPWIGPVAAAALLPINLFFCPRPAAELRLWAVAGLLGLLLDTALHSSGWIGFPAAASPGGDAALPPEGAALRLAPVWIVTLWVAFGSLLNSSLTWLRGRPLLTVLLSDDEARLVHGRDEVAAVVGHDRLYLDRGERQRVFDRGAQLLDALARA